MTHQDWTDQLRDKMADYEAAAPEGLWADIERSLPKTKSTVKPLWQRWMSAAAAIALMAGVAWWLWPENGVKEKQRETVSVARQNTEDVVSPQAEPAPLLVQSPPVTHQQHQSSYRPTSIKTTIEQQEETTFNVVKKDASTATVEKDIPTATASAAEASHHQPPIPPTSTRAVAEQTPIVHQTHRHRQVSIGLMADNGLMAYNHTNGVRMAPSMAKNYDFSSYMPTTRMPSSNEVIWLVGYEEHQHHDHPISFGLTVGYPLTPRWTLQSGVVYTRLHSCFVNKMPISSISTEQTLHYIGIPLNVQYLLLNDKHWKLYLTAGTQMDWNVRAKSETEGVETQMKKDRPQWSVGTAIGAEFDIIPQLGVYAEPGFRYYFDNGSRIQNYFKDKPSNWSLQLGLRFHFGR